MTEFSGFEDFADELNEFADDMRELQRTIRFAIDRGMRNVARAMAATMRELVPVDSGALRNSIRIEHPALMHYVIKAGNPDAGVDYAIWVEFGTGIHGDGNGWYTITPNDADALHFTVNGEEVFTQFVRHPGSPAQPYFRPGFTRHRDDFERIVMDEVETEVARVV